MGAEYDHRRVHARPTPNTGGMAMMPPTGSPSALTTEYVVSPMSISSTVQPSKLMTVACPPMPPERAEGADTACVMPFARVTGMRSDAGWRC